MLSYWIKKTSQFYIMSRLKSTGRVLKVGLSMRCKIYPNKRKVVNCHFSSFRELFKLLRGRMFVQFLFCPNPRSRISSNHFLSEIPNINKNQMAILKETGYHWLYSGFHRDYQKKLKMVTTKGDQK